MITEGFQFLRSDLVLGLFLMIAEAADAAERTRPMIVRQRSPAGATLSTCSERKRPTQTVSSGRSASLIGWLVEPTMALACDSVSTIWAIGGWRKVIRLWAGSNPVDRGRDVTEAAKGRSASRPAWEGGEGQRADVSTAPVVPEPAAGAVDERDRRDVREQHLIALAQPAVQAVFTDHHGHPRVVRRCRGVRGGASWLGGRPAYRSVGATVGRLEP